MSDYQPGEIVDVTIRGARVQDVFLAGVVLRLPPDGETFEVPLCDEITVERVAPEQWPPQPGDVWATPAGVTLFAVDIAEVMRENPDVRLVTQLDGRFYPRDAIREFGQLELVRREGEQS